MKIALSTENYDGSDRPRKIRKTIQKTKQINY